jgi:diketogulonate reductase-like aldo/keto reductase
MIRRDLYKRVVTLNNGVKMPALGLGTHKINRSDAISNAVNQYNFRHIDTSPDYDNDHLVGYAIKEVSSLIEKFSAYSHLFSPYYSNILLI